MSDYREGFLKAEEKAVDLVTQLDALKKEAISYRDAASTLKDVHEALLKMLNAQEEAAVNLRDVINTLLEIGTPEILEKLDSLGDSTKEHITISSSSISSNLETQINPMERSLRKINYFQYAIIGLIAVVGLFVVVSVVLNLLLV